MDASTRKYINELTQRIIDAYDISTPISDIESIVHMFGGVIDERIDFDDSCDGTIQKKGEYGFVIAISPFQNPQRKMFTIAHELGHLFLHMGFIIDRNLWQTPNETVYRRFGTSEQEYQANEFAASLLMPQVAYKRLLDQYSKNNMVDMSKVAKYFNVSMSAAINRGRFLGYLA